MTNTQDRAPAPADAGFVALLQQVAETATGACGLRSGQRVLIGSSGGADSTALTFALSALSTKGLFLKLELGYVDHGWRTPTEIEAEWQHVRSLATRLAVPAHRSVAPPPQMPQTEEAARRHRYAALAEMAHANAVDAIAVGHHAGDQAETFLMRLLRGSGPVGLAGMPARRPVGLHRLPLVRPLLRTSPQDLRAWLRASGISWCEDRSNADLSRDRARIRSRISQHAASSVAQLNRLCDRVRDRMSRREMLIGHQAKQHLRAYPFAGAIAMNRAWLRRCLRPVDLQLALRLAERQLASAPRPVWLTRRHLHLIGEVLDAGGALDLPTGLRFHARGKRAWLFERLRPSISIPVPSLLPSAPNDVASADFRALSTSAATLDADVLGGTPTLRRLRSGDRFCPFGHPSTRSLDIGSWLQKRGVPAFARRGILVLEGAQGIAWVVGEAIDQQHAITPATRRIVRVAAPESESITDDVEAR